MKISVTVNGVQHTDDVEPRTLLVQYVREVLGLTGTNIGCDTSSCGACSLHVDGEAVKSCTMLAAQADGATITTIEGMAGKDGSLHPMQKAFMENHGLQCGYCTPGMVMAATSLLKENPNPTEDDIRIPGYSSGLEDRLAVFEAVGGPRKTLAVFQGGSHSIFTDRSGPYRGYRKQL